jgi:hypothetical protein
MAGWLKLSRDINKHWIWEDVNYLHAWIAILINVNFEDKKVLIQGELLECKRGQSLLSVGNWIKEFRTKKSLTFWTPQRVKTFFNLLQEDEMIIIEGLHKTTRLTVCNYEFYQGSQLTDNSQITNKELADNSQITTTKEREEDRERKERKKNIVVEPWRSDFKIYLSDLRNTYRLLINDDSWIKERERFNPNLDIKLTIEKSCTEFWATEAGWAHKKKSKSKDIDWKKTLTTAISQPQNKVYKQKGTNLFQSEGSKRREAAAELGKMAEKVVQNTVVDLTKV